MTAEEFFTYLRMPELWLSLALSWVPLVFSALAWGLR